MTDTKYDPGKIDRIFTKLNTAWQLIGAFTAPVLFTLLAILFFTSPALNMYQWLLWLHLPVIMIHEFEEYTAPGGFKHFINTKTILATGDNREDVPLNEPYIFLVNPLLIWPWVIIGAVFYAIPWIGFAAILFQFAINNLQHVITFQLKNRGYNPGLFTTMLLLIPYCVVVAWYVIAHNVMTGTDWVLSFILFGVILGVLLTITHSRMKPRVTPAKQ
ncbi:MAG: HXXEE domain-containing protein [Methanomicrobiales archaeon]|nr:HXXEE domain-containing protein [Methanomicrobiales archaeon]